MAFLTLRTKSHKTALCEHLCAQHAQHPIRVCGLCVCGVKHFTAQYQMRGVLHFYRLCRYKTKPRRSGVCLGNIKTNYACRRRLNPIAVRPRARSNREAGSGTALASNLMLAAAKKFVAPAVFVGSVPGASEPPPNGELI
jgi:hypothetical protein